LTKADKPTTRLSYSMYRGREIAVTIHPTWLGFRLKGQRKVFQMDIEAAYQRAAQAEADKLRAERKALKLANKKQGRRRKL
jgi:cell division protein FtsB